MILISRISQEGLKSTEFVWGESGADWGKNGVKISFSKTPDNPIHAANHPRNSVAPDIDDDFRSQLTPNITHRCSRLTPQIDSKVVISLFYWAARQYSTLV